MFFAPGEPFVGKSYHKPHVTNTKTYTKVTLDILRIVRIEDLFYYEVLYGGILCHIRLFPFQVEMKERGIHKKQIACVYQGLDSDGNPKLFQDRDVLIDDLYEENTVHSFSYIKTVVDQRSDEKSEYHLMRDSYGLKHRLYAQLKEEQKVPGTRIDVYVRGINNKNKTLILSLYNPNIDRYEKIFFSANKVFEEIGEIDSKEQYFDCYFVDTDKQTSKLHRDLVGQYNGESNLWLFTYMNILDTIVVGTCIRKHHIEELAAVCNIMIKLQEWMVEGSTFLELFSDETKNTTITKSTSQIQKFNRILLAIDVVRRGAQYEYIGDIVSSIRKSGRIAIRRDERIEVMINILRIYPEYFTQDIEKTCNLIKALLDLEDGIRKYEIEYIASRLDYYVEADVRKMRSGFVRSNEIDTTQTLLINEVLALLCIKVLIHTNEKYSNELDARTCKARFFRFLSFVCSEDMQPVMLKAGIDALVGVIDGRRIFTWENAASINPITLCTLTAQAPVLDCNTDNDYYLMKKVGKTGIIRLDPTGFTIVPYKQCLINHRISPDFMNDIKIIHHLETLPIKLGTMLNVLPLVMERDAVKQFLLWQAITKHSERLKQGPDFLKPQVGDKVRVCVKEQNQSDELKHMLFVSVNDKRFAPVDGVLTPKDISYKWVEDARKLFKVGQMFYAEVQNITENGKYQFSIRNDVDRYATSVSMVEDDVKKLVLNIESDDNLEQMPKSFIQELILLVDMRIRRERNPMNKLTLIGYAYCMCALTSDSKSYYYDFLLRYYATIEKFVNNEYKEVNISFHDTINSKFPEIVSKRRLVELLNCANSQEMSGLQSLQTLAEEESTNDAGKFAAMLMAYIYAMKAGLSADAMSGIKKEINNFVGNSDILDLSALDSAIDEKENMQKSSDSDTTELDIETVDVEIIENPPKTDGISKEVAEEPLEVNVEELTPLKLNIFDDSSIQLTADDSHLDNQNAVITISIPIYAMNGIILLVNNEGGISKICVQDIVRMEKQTLLDSNVNPYKLNNHFVVPTDCIVGTIIISDKRKYIEIHNTKDMINSNFLQPKFIRYESIMAIRHQPFILPECCDIHGLKECCNKCIDSKDLPDNIIDGLQSYGVFI